MEISREEYLALTRRVEELEKMQALSPVSIRKGWAYAVNEMPLEKLSLKDSRSEIPEAEYNSISYDVWNYFVKLAKQIHSKCPKYKRKWDPYMRKFFWATVDSTDAPKNFRDLTDEQKLISLEMLNELIPIYNKYFRRLHPGIWIENKDGEEVLVEVSEE